MDGFDLYVFLLCLTVFLLLTATFGFLINYVMKLSIKLIRSGTEDEAIKKEFSDEKNKSKKSKALERTASLIICLFMIVLFVFSMCLRFQEEAYFENIPTLKVVATNSMAKKDAGNGYLTENSLDDQFARFDLLATYKTPAENELKLYDIVVYKIDDSLVIHRIVEIEEPNEKHPEHRLFILQGDNVSRPDRQPVKYSQIKGIYRGEKIPFVGSFIFFMQSFAGWLCILLIILAVIVSPILEKKIKDEKQKRLSSAESVQKKETAETKQR